MFANADFTQPGYEVARVIIIRSDTVVPAGLVSGTWTAAHSPYIVEGDVTVDPGETLTIEPGVVVYCDFFGNDVDLDGPEIPAGLGEITMTNHNGDPCGFAYDIFLDPLFVPETGDFHLQADSPCIDAGDPGSPPDPDGTIADIGALPYDQGTTGAPENAASGGTARLLSNRPEPFSGSTTLRFELPAAARVLLTVHGVSGRRVRTLLSEPEAAGMHSLHFDGRDDAGHALAPGVCFYRLRARGKVEARRLTLVR